MKYKSIEKIIQKSLCKKEALQLKKCQIIGYKVKVSSVHDCSGMSKSYHGEIKRAERLPVTKVIVAPFSGPIRMVDSNRFRDAPLILFIYFLFIWFFSKVLRPESPTRPKWWIRAGARFTPTVFIYLIKTFYLCHFVLKFSITRKLFQMVGP